MAKWGRGNMWFLLLVRYPWVIMITTVAVVGLLIGIAFWKYPPSSLSEDISTPYVGYEVRNTERSGRSLAVSNLVTAYEEGQIDLVPNLVLLLGIEIDNVTRNFTHVRPRRDLQSVLTRGNRRHSVLSWLQELVDVEDIVYELRNEYMQYMDTHVPSNLQSFLGMMFDQDQDVPLGNNYFANTTYTMTTEPDPFEVCANARIDKTKHARIVVGPAETVKRAHKGEAVDMFTAEKLKAVCALEDEYVYPHFNITCPSHTIGYYISMYAGKADCSEIDDEDVEFYREILLKCYPFYQDGRLNETCSQDRCPGVPQYCFLYDAVFKTFFYLASESFQPGVASANKYRRARDSASEQLGILNYTLIFLHSEHSDEALQNFYFSLCDERLECDRNPPSNEEVAIVAMMIFQKLRIFVALLLQDVYWLALAIALVFIVMLMYLRSFILVLATLVNVLFSFFLAYFLYHIVFTFTYFTFLNMLGILILIGVAADDVFLFKDSFDEGLRKYDEALEQQLRLNLKYDMQRSKLKELFQSGSGSYSSISNQNNGPDSYASSKRPRRNSDTDRFSYANRGISLESEAISDVILNPKTNSMDINSSDFRRSSTLTKRHNHVGSPINALELDSRDHKREMRRSKSESEYHKSNASEDQLHLPTYDSVLREDWANAHSYSKSHDQSLRSEVRARSIDNVMGQRSHQDSLLNSNSSFWRNSRLRNMPDNSSQSGLVQNQAYELSDTFGSPPIGDGTMSKKEAFEIRIKEGLRFAYRHAAVSILVTSLTTATALVANMASKVIAINMFGIFTMSLIVSNLFLMLSWIPAFVVSLEIIKEMRGQIPRSERRIKSRHFGAQVLDVVHLCKDYVFNVMIRQAVTWGWPICMFALIALGILGLIGTFVKPKLGLPSGPYIQILRKTNLMELYQSTYIYMFQFETPEYYGPNATVGFFWGVDDTDTSRRIDPYDYGNLTFEPFDMFNASSQVWLQSFCKTIQNQTFFADEMDSYPCSYDFYWFFMNLPCIDLPTLNFSTRPCCEHPIPPKADDLQYCLPYLVVAEALFIKSNKTIGYPIFNMTDNSVVAYAVLATWYTPLSLDYSVMDEMYKTLDNFFSAQLTTAPPGLENGWFWSYFYIYILQYQLERGTYSTLWISIITSFVIMFATTLNFLVSLYAIIVIIFVIFVVLGILAVLGWQLNVVQASVVTLAVGLSIDFAIHYGVAYLHSKAKTSRLKTEECVRNVGPAVMMSALTTFVAGAAMMPSQTVAFLEIGTFLMLTMAVSWVYSTFLLLSACRIIGPTQGQFCGAPERDICRVGHVDLTAPESNDQDRISVVPTLYRQMDESVDDEQPSTSTSSTKSNQTNNTDSFNAKTEYDTNMASHNLALSDSSLGLSAYSSHENI